MGGGVLYVPIVGAMIGLALPQHVTQIALGGTILGIVAIMLMALLLFAGFRALLQGLGIWK